MSHLLLVHFLNVVVSGSQTLLPSTTFLSFEGPQLPIDKKQVWFFREWRRTQPTGSGPSCCCLPALLPRPGVAVAPPAVWALSTCPCPMLAWKVLPCPQHQAAFPFTTFTFWARQGTHKMPVAPVSPASLPDFPPSLSALKPKEKGKHHAKCSWIYFCDSSEDTCLTHTLFPNKSTNKLGNLKRLIHALKNNPVDTGFTRLFSGLSSYLCPKLRLQGLNWGCVSAL